MQKQLDAVFFRTGAGNEPVRKWLKGMPKGERTPPDDVKLAGKRLKEWRNGEKQSS